jgi:nitrogen fixation NifU-like protein
MEHFHKPRNVGKINQADGFGEHCSDICGDLMQVYIKVEENRIMDVKYETLGCAASVASGSAVTELVKGKTVEEAERVTDKEIIDYLDGLPQPKIHCSILAVNALRKALEDYKSKSQQHIS